LLHKTTCYLNIIHFKEKVNMPNILQQGIFDERWCEWWNTQWDSQDFHSFSWGVKTRRQTIGRPCHTFIRLDKKTYCIKFGVEMFICRWYNWKGPMMWMSSVMEGNKKEKKQLVAECKVLKWVKTNSRPPRESPWWVPMVDGMIVTLPSRLQWL
jgi:hypothetical protein